MIVALKENKQEKHKANKLTNMKNIILLTFVMMLLTFTSCEVIGDIFSAGFYTGLFVVVAVIVLIIWLISKGRRRS